MRVFLSLVAGSCVGLCLRENLGVAVLFGAVTVVVFYTLTKD